jgi:hypothetical protein
MKRSHLNNLHPPRYRPIFSSARRDMGHSSRSYGGRVPTPRSGKWVITLRAVSDFPPGQYNGTLKYSEYDCVAVVPPCRKITGSGTEGEY